MKNKIRLLTNIFMICALMPQVTTVDAMPLPMTSTVRVFTVPVVRDMKIEANFNQSEIQLRYYAIPEEGLKLEDLQKLEEDCNHLWKEGIMKKGYARSFIANFYQRDFQEERGFNPCKNPDSVQISADIFPKQIQKRLVKGKALYFDHVGKIEAIANSSAKFVVDTWRIVSGNGFLKPGLGELTRGFIGGLTNELMDVGNSVEKRKQLVYNDLGEEIEVSDEQLAEQYQKTIAKLANLTWNKLRKVVSVGYQYFEDDSQKTRGVYYSTSYVIGRQKVQENLGHKKALAAFRSALIEEMTNTEDKSSLYSSSEEYELVIKHTIKNTKFATGSLRVSGALEGDLNGHIERKIKEYIFDNFISNDIEELIESKSSVLFQDEVLASFYVHGIDTDLFNEAVKDLYQGIIRNYGDEIITLAPTFEPFTLNLESAKQHLVLEASKLKELEASQVKQIEGSKD